MAHAEGMEDYLNFMHWFQQHYPELYTNHWKVITMPVDGEGVTVDKDSMDQALYHKIIAITQAYYKKENQ